MIIWAQPLTKSVRGRAFGSNSSLRCGVLPLLKITNSTKNNCGGVIPCAVLSLFLPIHYSLFTSSIPVRMALAGRAQREMQVLTLNSPNGAI